MTLAHIGLWFSGAYVLFVLWMVWDAWRAPTLPPSAEDHREAEILRRAGKRMAAINAIQEAMRNEESGASIGITDEILNAFAVAVVLAIECKEIEGMIASWAS